MVLRALFLTIGNGTQKPQSTGVKLSVKGLIRQKQRRSYKKFDSNCGVHPEGNTFHPETDNDQNSVKGDQPGEFQATPTMKTNIGS